MTSKEFCAKHTQYIFSTESISRRPDKDPSDKWGSDHWLCTIAGIKCSGAFPFSFYYSKGIGCRKNGTSFAPTLPEALECLASDCAAIDQPFEDWAGDYGYDVDSRKAEKMYRTIQDQANALRKLFGAAVYADFLEIREE